MRSASAAVYSVRSRVSFAAGSFASFHGAFCTMNRSTADSSAQIASNPLENSNSSNSVMAVLIVSSAVVSIMPSPSDAGITPPLYC